MNLYPLRTLSNTGVLFGGQASAWQPQLAGYAADEHMRDNLLALIKAAHGRLGPIAREITQIVPGGTDRLVELLSGGDPTPQPLDEEAAVSVPGILLGQIASVIQLAALGLPPESYESYGHSQGIMGARLLRSLPAEELAADTSVVDHVAFAMILGAATSQARFGGMLAVRGVPVGLLPGTPAVINGPTRAVYSGTPEELAATRRAITELVDKHNARIETHERGGEPVELSFVELPVAEAFHHPGNRAAADQAVAWSNACGLEVPAAEYANYILVDPCTWEVGEHDYLLSLDPALIAITADLTDAVILDASTPFLRDELARPGTTFPEPVDYSRFAPQAVTLADGSTKVQTAFSRLTGLSPIILAGMTPTTVDG